MANSMFQTSKSILLSKTFWGATVAFLAAMLPLLGIGLTSEDINSTAHQASGIIDQLLVMAGSVLAIYGRVSATTEVHVLPK